MLALSNASLRNLSEVVPEEIKPVARRRPANHESRLTERAVMSFDCFYLLEVTNSSVGHNQLLRQQPLCVSNQIQRSSRGRDSKTSCGVAR